MQDVLHKLHATLEARKNASPTDSYVASLYREGINRILEKLSEETTEVILAAKDHIAEPDYSENIASEVADLWFHSLVMLCHLNLSYETVLRVLENRMGQSGLAEKETRISHNEPTSRTKY